MAMQVGNRNDSDPTICDMNTTPLIDVMLVLLVMLIVTIPIQTHAVKLDMPVVPPRLEPREVVNLGFDFDGTPTWNGVPVPSRARLDRYFADIAAQIPQPEIHVKPDRLVQYGAVALALADAQRLGVTNIGFTGNEQYIE